MTWMRPLVAVMSTFLILIPLTCRREGGGEGGGGGAHDWASLEGEGSGLSGWG
jgi:hypothetical protein